MEKLIELLNDYEKDKIKNSEGLDVMYIWKNEGTLHYYNNYKDENVFDNVRFLIISKEYEFIKWLVKNDKIDYDKVCNSKNYYSVDVWDNTDELIMLLSIEDNPIQFLCEILK